MTEQRDATRDARVPRGKNSATPSAAEAQRLRDLLERQLGVLARLRAEEARLRAVVQERDSMITELLGELGRLRDKEHRPEDALAEWRRL